jgi:hypothetical protein
MFKGDYMGIMAIPSARRFISRTLNKGSNAPNIPTHVPIQNNRNYLEVPKVNVVSQGSNRENYIAIAQREVAKLERDIYTDYHQTNISPAQLVESANLRVKALENRGIGIEEVTEQDVNRIALVGPSKNDYKFANLDEEDLSRVSEEEFGGAVNRYDGSRFAEHYLPKGFSRKKERLVKRVADKLPPGLRSAAAAFAAIFGFS